MGHRLEAFVNESDAAAMIEIAQSVGIEAKIVGRCEVSTTGKNQLTILHAGETIQFED